MKKFKLLGSNGRYDSEHAGAFGGHGGSKIHGRLDCPRPLRAVVDSRSVS